MGVKIDQDDPEKVARPSGTDVLRLVNGVWQDLAPYHIQDTCTHLSDGTAAGQSWRTQSWDFEPLADGTFHGNLASSAETDGCGDKGDTALVPIVATKVGPVPPGVLTPVRQG
jgi:serine/threonine-protein kinase